MIKVKYSSLCDFQDEIKQLYQQILDNTEGLLNDADNIKDYVSDRISAINNQINRLESILSSAAGAINRIKYELCEAEQEVVGWANKCTEIENNLIPVVEVDEDGNEYIVWVIDEAGLAIAEDGLADAEKKVEEINGRLSYANSVYDNIDYEISNLSKIGKAAEYVLKSIKENYRDIEMLGIEVSKIIDSNNTKIQGVVNKTYSYLKSGGFYSPKIVEE